MAGEVAPWLTPAAVVAQIPGVQLDNAGELPADVELIRAAAGNWVEDQRRDLAVPAVLDDAGAVVTPASFSSTPRIVLGAAMYVGRLVARKGSPQGLASFGEFGPATVLRQDPDVAQLLGIGRYGKPVAR